MADNSNKTKGIDAPEILSSSVGANGGKITRTQLDPVQQAAVISLRQQHKSIRAIALEMGCSEGQIERFLRSEQVMALMEAEAKAIMRQTRNDLKRLTTKAVEVIMDTLEDVENDDRSAVAVKVLQGVGILNQHSEVEVSTKNPLANRTPSELAFIKQHGHLPEDPCACNDDYVPQAEFLAQLESDKGKKPQ